MAIWCWRPECKAPTPVLEENYRCCCGCCNSGCGFRTIVYLSLTLAVLGWPLCLIIVIGGNSIPSDQWILLASISFYAFLGLAAVRTLRPVFMQIYLVLAVISGVFALLGLFLMFCLAVAAVFGNSHEAKEMIRNLDKDQKAQISTDDLARGLLVMAPLQIGVVIWHMRLIYSYYSYIRDRQLEIEEGGGGQAGRDVEKQQDHAPLNPPPY